MTDVIGYTHKHLFEQVNFMKRCFENESGSLGKVKVLEDRIETHLEELRKDRAALVTERDTLRNRVQVLEMANATSGEVIRSLKREAEQARKALMVARLTEFAAQVSSEKEKAVCATCGGLETVYTLPLWGESAIFSVPCPACSEQSRIDIRKPACMHSFHPAFPSGELCTFCGVGK